MLVMICQKSDAMWDYAAGLFGLKYLIGVIGGVLVMIGSSIEPSAGIWIVAMGGTLLTAAFGRDRSLHAIVLYVFMGLGWGIFGSQIIYSLFPVVPQKAVAFFIAMFGAEATSWVLKAMREGSITELLTKLISNFKPFNFINKGSKE